MVMSVVKCVYFAPFELARWVIRKYLHVFLGLDPGNWSGSMVATGYQDTITISWCVLRVYCKMTSAYVEQQTKLTHSQISREV